MIFYNFRFINQYYIFNLILSNMFICIAKNLSLNRNKQKHL